MYYLVISNGKYWSTYYYGVHTDLCMFRENVIPLKATRETKHQLIKIEICIKSPITIWTVDNISYLYGITLLSTHSTSNSNKEMTCSRL